MGLGICGAIFQYKGLSHRTLFCIENPGRGGAARAWGCNGRIPAHRGRWGRSREASWSRARDFVPNAIANPEAY